jgi:hypothetical protein
VTVAQADYASQTLPPFSLAAGTTRPLGTITLVANPAALSGHVTSSAGARPSLPTPVAARAPSSPGRGLPALVASCTRVTLGPVNRRKPATLSVKPATT